MINSVIIDGRICNEFVELKTLTNGTELCKFSIANDRGWGEKKKAGFFKVTCFGSAARFVNAYCGKGDLITVQGSLDYNKYTNKNSASVVSIEIIADSVEKRSSKGEAKPKVDINIDAIDVEDVEDELPF